MKILFLTLKKDSPSARWRVMQLLPFLEKEGIESTVEDMPDGMLGRLSHVKMAAEYDLVVVQKRLLTRMVFNRLRKYAKKLVFEFDDTVTLKRGEDRAVRSSQTKERRFRRMILGCDAVITTNEYLAETAFRESNDRDRIHILPSVIDPTRYEVRPPANREGPLTIGWMGTSANLSSLHVLRRPLARLCRRFEGVRLKIVSEQALSLEGLPIEHKSFRLDEEIQDLQSFDMAIAPLVEDPWTRGKISTKVLAYAATGLPIVASNIAANRLYLKHGVTGFLAGTLTEWEENLTALVESPDLRDRIGAAARASVEEEFSLQVMAPRYVELFRRVVTAEPVVTSADPEDTATWSAR
jgi:glycosyltransferase involved in cell wall biosynthesis